jgi:kynureninase
MNPLAAHYSRFRVSERLLLTGHSHQAWPDVALEGHVEAFEDAARHVDDKWERAFAKADEVRAGYRRLLGDPGGEIALGASTHELVLRFLSALDLRERPRLVSTDGEFHTLRRQLARLGEEHLDVVRLPAEPAQTLAERLAAAVDERTSAVLVSAVLFESARIVPGLGALAAACTEAGVAAARRRLPRARRGPVRPPRPRAGRGVGGRRRLQVPAARRGQLLPAPARARRWSCAPRSHGWYAEFGRWPPSTTRPAWPTDAGPSVRGLDLRPDQPSTAPLAMLALLRRAG